MRSLMDCRGVVTVFLIIIFTAMVILVGVVLDMVRILVAEKKVYSSLCASARSVLAAYDRDLVGEFGIYAVEPDSAQARKYYINNLEERHQSFSLIKYEVRKFETYGLINNSLLEDEQLKIQILEYMKYKAPLQAGEDVIQMLSRYDLPQKIKMVNLGQEILEKRNQLSDAINALNKEIDGPINYESLKVLESLQSNTMSQLDDYIAALKRTEKIISQNEKETRELSLYLQELGGRIQHNLEVLMEVKQSYDKSGQESEDELQKRMVPLEKYNFSVIVQQPIEERGERKDSIKIKQILRNLCNDSDINQEEAALLERDSIYEMIDGGDKEKAMIGKKVLEYAASINEKLGQFLVDGRDRYYCSSYILDKFTFLTSTTARDRCYSLGEIEYILCGRGSEIANLLETMNKLWFLRFTVNVLESFVKSQISNLAARTLAALGEGFYQACSDIVQLYDGKKISFADSLSEYKLGYRDHLGILLLLQNQTQQFGRVRNLVQLNLKNKKIAAENYYTYITAKTETLIDLWFLPVLHLDKLGLKNFEGHNYRICKEVNMGY